MTGTNMAPHSGEAPEVPEELDRGITLPVNVKIEADHKVYDLSEPEAGECRISSEMWQEKDRVLLLNASAFSTSLPR